MAYTTIDNPELYFQCKIWTGNNSGSGISITLDGDENLSPNLVWVKSRDATHAHVLYDSVRTSPAKYLLQPNNAIAERTATIGSFDSDGVTFSDNDGFYNGSGTYVGWFWKESTTAGLDIVSFTGSGSARTVSHSLSAVPHLMWVKNRADATQHNIYHHKNTSNPETEIIYVNLTNATSDDNGFWDDTAPTSSVFTVGGDNGTNGSSDAIIAYLWTEKQGFSKFGSYQGNSSTDGSFIYCGFSPAWIMVKKTNESDSADWLILDNKRDTFNPRDSHLDANQSDAESSASWVYCDHLSNGFKWRANDETHNESGSTYIFMAFAEAPFVNSKGVPANAR